MAGAALCHIRREGLKFLVPVSQEGQLHLLRRGMELMSSQSAFCFFVS